MAIMLISHQLHSSEAQWESDGVPLLEIHNSGKKAEKLCVAPEVWGGAGAEEVGEGEWRYVCAEFQYLGLW